MTISMSIHVVASDTISFCLWQSTSLLCVHLLINTQYNVYTNTFIFSFVDGHLGSFHILTIVNSPTMKSGMQVCFQIRVFGGFLDEYSGVEFLAPMLVLFLVF